MNVQKTVLIPLEKYERLLRGQAKGKEEEQKEDQTHKYTTMVMNLSEGSVSEKNQSGLDKEIILDSLPKMYRSKGRALLNYIEQANSMTWNDKGELIYLGKVIVNSHITDLLKATMREHKNFNPIGQEEFLEGLSQSNIPLLLLDNKQSRQHLQERKNKMVRKFQTRHKTPYHHNKSKWIHI